MDGKVCLDTDASIYIIKGGSDAERIVNLIRLKHICVSVVTVFELNLRETNIAEVQMFLKDINILPIDETTALEASSIFKGLKKKGKIIEFQDIFIAASAKVNDCELLTFNTKHFSSITGLRLFPNS